MNTGEKQTYTKLIISPHANGYICVHVCARACVKTSAEDDDFQNLSKGETD